MDKRQKEQLLALGIDPKTGRKIRSDKGKERGPNAHTRSDKGQSRPTAQGVKSALATYTQMKGNLLSKKIDPTQPDYTLEEDVNHIFMPMVKHNYAVYARYTVVNRAKCIARTVKYQKGYTTDLERRRWAALYELNQENLVHRNKGFPISKAFEREATLFQVDNTYDLMCYLYHIAPEDQIRWTYEEWIKCYTVLGGAQLDKDFVFVYGKTPGQKDYMPEFAENLQTFEELMLDEIINSQAYKIERARVRDLEYSKLVNQFIQHMLTLPQYMNSTITTLKRLATKEAQSEQNQKWIDECIDRRMKHWLESNK